MKRLTRWARRLGELYLNKIKLLETTISRLQTHQGLFIHALRKAEANANASRLRCCQNYWYKDVSNQLTDI
jgi:hypothetical protein